MSKDRVALEVTQTVDVKNPNTCQWVQFTPRRYDAIDRALARAVEATGRGHIVRDEMKQDKAS